MKSIISNNRIALLVGMCACIVLTTFSFSYAQTENLVPSNSQAPRPDASKLVPVQRQIKLSEQIQKRIINLSDNVIRRAGAAIKRIENIIARIDTRIIKLADQGVDVSPALLRLNETKIAIGSANAYIDKLPSVATAVTSEKPREAFARIRLEFQQIQNELLTAKKGLVETIALLKEAVRNSEQHNGSRAALENGSNSAE